MPKRICSTCGNLKDVRGGKICETGHFICRDCIWVRFFELKICPLCKKPMK